MGPVSEMFRRTAASEPTLLFGVGATKSGTSWLHEALACHPQAHFRSIKELHYFDALHDDRIERLIATVHNERDALNARLDIAPRHKRAELRQRIVDRDDWLAVLGQGGESAPYLAYLQAGRGAARLIGDVTPAYALLPVERLRAMAGLMADVRFIYIMRDPVARLWSHVRMMAARRGDTGRVDPRRARNILNRTLNGDEHEIEIRGDYAGALTRLGEAVAPERLLVLYYEDLFGADGMARVCDFLGVTPQDVDTTRRVHAGDALDMPAGLRDKAATWLAPQYEFVAHRMGRLPGEWQGNMMRV